MFWFFLNKDAIVNQLCKSFDCQSVVFTRRSRNSNEIYQCFIKQNSFVKFKVHAGENSMFSMFTGSI